MGKPHKPALVKIESTIFQELEPDQITLAIEFSDELDTKEECLTQYNQDLEAVLKALESAGISRQEVAQSRFSLCPNKETAYKKVDGKKDEYYRAYEFVDGCEYSGESTVILDADQETFAKVWLALFETEGAFTFQVSYGLKDRAAAEAQLLNSAVDQARARAQILALAAGASLGSIHTLKHDFSSGTGLSWNYNDNGLCYRESCAMDLSLSKVPEFNPEKITVSCDVSCSWELVPE